MHTFALSSLRFESPCSSATSKMFLRLLFSKRVMQNLHNDDVFVLKTNSRADVKLKYY